MTRFSLPHPPASDNPSEGAQGAAARARQATLDFARQAIDRQLQLPDAPLFDDIRAIVAARLADDFGIWVQNASYVAVVGWAAGDPARQRLLGAVHDAIVHETLPAGATP
jgi:hypothetical protein